MGLILTYFQFATRRQRMGLVAAAMLALALTAMADSRSALVALALGSSLYACWRYGWKGVLVALGAACVAVAALIIAGPALAPYVWRGDIQTVTGRAQMQLDDRQTVKIQPSRGHGAQPLRTAGQPHDVVGRGEVSDQLRPFGQQRIGVGRLEELLPVAVPSLDVMQPVSDVRDDPVDVEHGEGHGCEGKLNDSCASLAPPRPSS